MTGVKPSTCISCGHPIAVQFELEICPDCGGYGCVNCRDGFVEVENISLCLQCWDQADHELDPPRVKQLGGKK